MTQWRVRLKKLKENVHGMTCSWVEGYMMGARMDNPADKSVNGRMCALICWWWDG